MSAAATLAILEERCAAVAGHLERALAAVDEELAPGTGSVLATGGGLSEGPAHFLVALLAELGVPAAYVPLSEFAAPSVPGSGDTLVVFSQGLAPNARYPLEHIDAFRRVVLVTAVVPDGSAPPGDVRRRAAEAERRGARLVVLPHFEEPGLLLRVIGPPVASLAAAILAGALARRCGRPDPRSILGEVPARYRAVLAEPVAPGAGLVQGGELAPVALVASGRYATACHALRWKLLEGLHLPDPPVWDVLAVAHGPFQSFHERAHTLLVLERAGASHEARLVERLAEVLVPGRHRLLRLPSRLPGLYAWFEHDARLDALLLDALRARPLDLAAWPGQGRDGPLYDLSP